MMTEAEMGLRGLLGLSGGGGWHGHGGWGGRRHYGGGWWGPGSWYWGGAPLVIQAPPDPTAQLQAQQALQAATQALVAAETPWYTKVPWYGWLVLAGAAYMVLKPKRAVANRRRRNGRGLKPGARVRYSKAFLNSRDREFGDAGRYMGFQGVVLENRDGFVKVQGFHPDTGEAFTFGVLDVDLAKIR